jgi:hypothetical protein
MSFPQTNWLGLKKGWSSRGNVKNWYSGKEDIYRFTSCSNCHTRAKIGIELGGQYDRFLYCPKCLVKLSL